MRLSGLCFPYSATISGMSSPVRSILRKTEALILFVALIIAVFFFFPFVSRAAASQSAYSSGNANAYNAQNMTGAGGAAKGLNNVGGTANAICNGWTPKQGPRQCWVIVGYIPVEGQCAGSGVCRATTVGTLTAAFFNPGANMAVSKMWGSALGTSRSGTTASTPAMYPIYYPPQQTKRVCTGWYYYVSTPTTATSDPCAVYKKPTAI